ALLSKNEAFSAEFPEPQVTSLGGGSGGKYHEFSIKLKLNPEKRRELEKRKAEARKNNQDYTAPYLTLIKGALEQQLTYDPYEDPKAYTVTISGVPRGGGECRIHFTSAVRAEDLRQQLEKRNAGVKVFVLDASGERVDEQEGTDFLVALDLPAGTESGQLPPKLSQDLAGLTDMKGQEVALSSPFPEESLIDPRAVGHLTQAALASIILSLFLIVMYIRVRFHEFKYGIAACIALIHDVSIVLGITVLLNRYEIIHAEIDLSMIAAFLTIIGYSLNDTIVMFDRIRENLNLKKKFGETKLDFRRLVDQSVDQNLSRTVLTSVTTFLVVSAQFVFNHGAGSVLEGFSFAMMAGIIVGTYSSIWVANPIVLWLHEREAALARSAASPGPATLGTTP
ncbi:MAG: protein translocase subunit SecF, partial [Planctomycetota bacterium]